MHYDCPYINFFPQNQTTIPEGESPIYTKADLAAKMSSYTSSSSGTQNGYSHPGDRFLPSYARSNYVPNQHSQHIPHAYHTHPSFYPAASPYLQNPSLYPAYNSQMQTMGHMPTMALPRGTAIVPPIASDAAPGAIKHDQAAPLPGWFAGGQRYPPLRWRPSVDLYTNKINPYGRGFPHGFYKTDL